MSSLPPDLLERILAYFNCSSFAKLVLVCSRWRDVIVQSKILWSEVEWQSKKTTHFDTNFFVSSLANHHANDVLALKIESPQNRILKLNQFTNLTRLSLSHPLGLVAPLEGTPPLPNLRYVDLSGSLRAKVGISEFLSICPMLEFLRLNVGGDIWSILNVILEKKQLKCLDMATFDVTEDDRPRFSSRPDLFIICKRNNLNPDSRFIENTDFKAIGFEELKQYKAFIRQFTEFGRWLLFLFFWEVKPEEFIKFLVEGCGISANQPSPSLSSLNWSPFSSLIHLDKSSNSLFESQQYPIHALIGDSLRRRKYSDTEFESLCTFLITCGCSINARDKSGFTPLNRACKLGYASYIKFFLANGSNPNITDSTGKLPLTNLIDSCFLESETLVDLLLDSGSLVNSPFHPPVIYALRTQRFSITEKLILRGAKISTDDKHQNAWYNLMYKDIPYSVTDCVKIANLLISNGASLEEVDIDGDTPLLKACKKCYYGIASVIVENTTSQSILDYRDKFNGWGPIHYIVRWASATGAQGKGFSFVTRNNSLPVLNCPTEPLVFTPFVEQSDHFYNISASTLFASYSPEELRWAHVCRTISNVEKPTPPVLTKPKRRAAPSPLLNPSSLSDFSNLLSLGKETEENTSSSTSKQNEQTQFSFPPPSKFGLSVPFDPSSQQSQNSNTGDSTSFKDPTKSFGFTFPSLSSDSNPTNPNAIPFPTPPTSFGNTFPSLSDSNPTQEEKRKKTDPDTAPQKLSFPKTSPSGFIFPFPSSDTNPPNPTLTKPLGFTLGPSITNEKSIQSDSDTDPQKPTFPKTSVGFTFPFQSSDSNTTNPPNAIPQKPTFLQEPVGFTFPSPSSDTKTTNPPDAIPQDPTSPKQSFGFTLDTNSTVEEKNKNETPLEFGALTTQPKSNNLLTNPEVNQNSPIPLGTSERLVEPTTTNSPAPFLFGNSLLLSSPPISNQNTDLEFPGGLSFGSSSPEATLPTLPHNKSPTSSTLPISSSPVPISTELSLGDIVSPIPKPTTDDKIASPSSIVGSSIPTSNQLPPTGPAISIDNFTPSSLATPVSNEPERTTGFSFGPPKSSSPSTPASESEKTTTGFSFGQTATSTVSPVNSTTSLVPTTYSTGILFGSSSGSTLGDPSTTTTGLSFGQMSTTTATPSTIGSTTTGFSFGQTAPSASPSTVGSTTGFSFGQTTSSTTSPSTIGNTTGFSFGQTTSSTTSPSPMGGTTNGFSFGQTTSSTTSPSPIGTTGFSFGQTATSTISPSTIGSTTTGFSFGTNLSSTQPQSAQPSLGTTSFPSFKDLSLASPIPSESVSGSVSSAPSVFSPIATDPSSISGFTPNLFQLSNPLILNPESPGNTFTWKDKTIGGENKLYVDAFDVLEILIKKVDVNSLTLDNETPILIALRTSYSEFSANNVVQILIDAEADISLKDKNESTCLHATAMKFNSKTMNFILEKWKGSIDPVDNFRVTPFLQACKVLARPSKSSLSKNIDCSSLQTLLFHGTNLQLQEKYTLRTALHYVASSNYTDLLQSISTFPVDYNMRDVFGFTPLRFAVELQNWTMVISMLNLHRCNANAACFRNQTPFLRILEMIAYTESTIFHNCGFEMTTAPVSLVSESIIEKNGIIYPVSPQNQFLIGNTKFNMDFQSKDLFNAVKLLSEQHDFHIVGSGGLIALHWVLPMMCFLEFGWLQKLFRNIILSSSSRLLNSQDDKGDTPLTKLVRVMRMIYSEFSQEKSFMTTFKNRFTDIPEMIQFMIKNGASSSIPNNQGLTALMMVCEIPLDVTDTLINLSTDKNANYKHPITQENALHIFVKKRTFQREEEIKILKKLLEFIDPNECDSAGFTPLMIACNNLSYVCVNALLEHKGINVNTQNPHNGKTALHYLASHAHPCLLPIEGVPTSPSFHPNILILRMVSQAGASIHIKDNTHTSPLQLLPFLFEDQ